MKWGRSKIFVKKNNIPKCLMELSFKLRRQLFFFRLSNFNFKSYEEF